MRYTFAAMGASASRAVRFQVASDQALIVYFDAPAKKTGAKAPPLQNQITIEGHEKVRRLLRLLELEPIAESASGVLFFAGQV